MVAPKVIKKAAEKVEKTDELLVACSVASMAGELVDL